MTSPRPGLVDVHSHFVTRDYVDAAVTAGRAHPDGMPAWPEWSEDAHLHLMDECGIDTSMLSLSSPGVHFGDDRAAKQRAEAVNDFGSSLARRRPDRFGHFAALPLPDVPAAIAETDRALGELGSDGVAIETNANGVYLGDRRLTPLWEALDARQAIVFVHPTSPPNADSVTRGRPAPMIEFLFDSARAAVDLVFAGTVDRFPQIRWVFTHGAGVLPLLTARVELFRELFLKQSPGESAREVLSRLWFDLAGTPFPDQVPAAVHAFGSSRLLYGSDFCFTPADGVRAQARSVDQAIAPESGTWRELTTANVRRLLPRLR